MRGNFFLKKSEKKLPLVYILEKTYYLCSILNQNEEQYDVSCTKKRHKTDTGLERSEKLGERGQSWTHHTLVPIISRTTVL